MSQAVDVPSSPPDGVRARPPLEPGPHRPTVRPSFLDHLHPPTIPGRESRFRYTFGLGGISLFLFMVLVVTGVLELFYYTPSLAEANASVQILVHLVPYGWLVRGLHYWAGQAIVVAVGLHLLRVVLTGAYKSPRRLNWLLGLCLLVLTVLLDFSGLVLRWDQTIAWALMVGTNLIRSIPLLGPSLYLMAVGSEQIGETTPVHFYAWHIFGLALPAFIVIVWHAFRVRRDGGISHREPPAGAPAPPSPDRIPRSELLRREAVASLLGAATLIALTLLFPPGLAPKADFQNLPADASAPWFFLWVQQLLRFGDPFWMGVAVPIASLTLLALLPFYVDRDPAGVGEWFNRRGRLAQTLALSMLALILALVLRGVLTR